MSATALRQGGAPLFTAQTTPGSDIFTRDSLAPRLGVSYDLSNNRSDATPILDFRVDKSFEFGSRYRITGMFDLFNTLNSNAVTRQRP